MVMPRVLGRLEVDVQLQLRGLLHRQISGLLALENAPGIDAGQAVPLPGVRSVAYQTSRATRRLQARHSAPIDNGRWSAIRFDRARYTVRQEPTSAQPFVANIAARTVVFDAPYFDLSQAPAALGITNWGAHDPGIATNSRPAGLFDELNRRFGAYPATQWIYAFCWPSAEKTRVASDALVHAVNVRAQAARWLLTKRLPDWDLALVVVSETHSAIEPFWHGIDRSHPLNGVPSAAAAATGLRDVYIAVDKLIGT